jgi:hypothetical protein
VVYCGSFISVFALAAGVVCLTALLNTRHTFFQENTPFSSYFSAQK